MSLEIPLAATAVIDPQLTAADPALSAFVTANAGSGKTKTLIDRVARLLLARAKPETILCVTYTRAAASEMQRRLFQVLGGWSVDPDAKLRETLALLQDADPAAYDEAKLSEARGLFAQALETPGGLKIQTIHAFCEKLLRRFPLEAAISPGFKVMDDSAAASVAAAARRAVAHHALAASDAIADAYARLSVALDFQAFQGMLSEFEARRGTLFDFFRREGGLHGAIGWVWRAVDVPRGSTPEDLAAETMSKMDRGLYRRAADALNGGGKQDQERAHRFAALSAEPEPDLDAAFDLFFNKEGDARAWVQTSAKLKADPTLQHLLLCEQARLDQAYGRIRGARIAIDTADVLTLAYGYLAAYRREKESAGALDFADLIEKTCHLLRDRPAAAWVLFKLDGGVDHILVDEAQDTAPDQWTIIDALTEEFFSGAGVGGETRERGLFVVGDEKQSIYSFQGARPELLRRKFEFHRDRATGAGFRFERVDLLTSWRSTPQVLTFVDAVFAPAELATAIQPGGEAVVHKAVRLEHAGCVDIWPLEVDRKADERAAWDAPLDAEPEDSANRRLARRIAAEIKALIARGEGVFDKDARVWRPAHAGDVLILVRRRRALFEDILRALKQAEIPVAGADRLALSAHIVFDDLMALARFVRFPADELTLAALLKSPLCGLDDDSLYSLAHGRTENLWGLLGRRAGERPDWTSAAAFLNAAAALAASQRPFEFYARILGMVGPDGRSIRQRLLRRLGAEAEDALDEYLNQVLAAEARGVRDLERLAADFAGLDITVKREMEAERPEVRVMTAHGAKGLEAPIVFLPETALTQVQRGSPLLRVDRPDDGGFLWCTSGAKDCEATAAARETRARRDEEEAYRLLYVALTRARDRLILCGRRAERTDEAKIKGWWAAIKAALDHADVAANMRTVSGEAGLEVSRFGPDPRILGPAASDARAAASLPAWIRAQASPEVFGRYASPSDLGEGAVVAAPSPLAARGGLGRFRRGDLIHRLLQLLPDLETSARADAALALLAREPDLTLAQRQEMAAAAMSVLDDPRFAEVFGPGSRAEVAIAGGASGLPAGLKVSGRIDRLVVLEGRVMVVDFKTSRPSPARIEDADPAYLRQMAIYAAVLADVFPGRVVEAALVWTDGPKLMAVPEKMITAALADLGRSA